MKIGRSRYLQLDQNGRWLLAFGKYSGWFLDDVVEENMRYLEWFLDQDIPRDVSDIVEAALG